MNERWRGFFAGWVAACAATSLLQDWRGKEAWLRQIEGTWVSAWVSVPIALVGLAWVIGVMRAKRSDA